MAVGSRLVMPLLACVFVACTSIDPETGLADLLDVDMPQAGGLHGTLRSAMGAKATVLFTLDPDCPFCQAYAPALDSLEQVYEEQGVRFAGLVSAGFIAAEDVARFANASNLDFPIFMDADCHIAKAVHARVTPECFVLDANGAIRYHGAIDNMPVRSGRKRLNATEHFLSAALDQLLGAGSVIPTEVQAVGCIVECESGDDE